MKGFGTILIIVGCIWGVVAFSMSTSVEVGGTTIGAGEYSINIPRQEVHNLDRSERRSTHLMISGVLVIVGSILFGFGAIRNSSDTGSATNTRKCPFCAELVKTEATICRFCQKDIPLMAPSPAASAQEPMQTNFCPYCKDEVLVTSNYCMRCNKYFSAA